MKATRISVSTLKTVVDPQHFDNLSSTGVVHGNDCSIGGCAERSCDFRNT